MEIISDNPNYKFFTFKPTKALLNHQESYASIKNTHDPNLISEFLHTNPYFPLALYDLGEYLRLQGNFKDANFMMEKLLFFYEDSFDYHFNIFGNKDGHFCFLDFSSSIYNEIFYRSILKFIIIINKRACYRSALEYCKLLLKLNPIEDKLGALVLIDHCALNA